MSVDIPGNTIPRQPDMLPGGAYNRTYFLSAISVPLDSLSGLTVIFFDFSPELPPTEHFFFNRFLLAREESIEKSSQCGQ